MTNQADKLTKKDKVISVTILGIAYLFICAIAALYAYVTGAQLTVARTLLTYAAIAILFAVLYIYIFFQDRAALKKPKLLVLVTVVLTVCLAINLLVGQGLHMYLRPLALAGLIIAVLTTRSLGIYVNLVHCVLIFIIDQYCTPGGFMLTYSLMDILLGVVCGILFLFMTMKTRKRIDIVTLGFKLCLVTGATALVIEALGGVFGMNLLYAFLWGALCSVLTVVLFMSMLPVFENAFNMVTDYRLMELTDHSNKLLMELAKKAPGTFNHSIVVGNLAEMCALAIGENTNLARAASYYHDIGKILNPEYFKENQSSGENPHDDITPEVSVSIIKNHTVNGAKLGKENRLPKQLLDVMLEHHGTLPIKVFYYKALKYTDGNLGLDHFSYDGPKPHSRIAAIIMIVDASEAAVRVTQDKSYENAMKIISEIIDERMRLNQFTECDITMHELAVIRDTLVKSMSGVYHERIQYPDIKLGTDGVEPERKPQ